MGGFFPGPWFRAGKNIPGLDRSCSDLLFLLLWKFRKASSGNFKIFNPERKIALLHGIYIVLYGLIVILSKTWIDPDIGLSDRILSPMLVSMLILLASGRHFYGIIMGKPGRLSLWQDLL